MKTPVPFEQARIATVNAKRAETRIAIATTPPATAPEIVELARALRNDPDLIYQYVHDNIEFSPLWGYLKGPVGTLLDGRGDSFDQAALMVALLNQASLSNNTISNVGFEYGQLNLTSPQLQAWLGVDSNPNSVGGVLASGGIPASTFGNGAAIVGEIWVQVSINGTAYVFDPAFKAHTWKTGLISSLPGIMGYTQAQFIADSGANPTAISVQGVNRTALRNDLATYAGKLATYVRTNMPTAGVSDLVGGGTIVPAPFTNLQTVRQTTNPNQYAPPTAWTAIPSEYFATLSISIPGAPTQTFNSTDIYGHRLSIFFSSSYIPTMYLDGVAVVSGSAQFQGAQVAIQESTSLPFASFADQSVTQYVSADSNQNGNAGYVVQTGWDQVGRGMVEKHRKLLTQAIASGASPTSELVLGETVAMLGYTWLAECAAQQHISDQLLGTVSEYFYGGGITGEAVANGVSSPYVDLPLNFVNTPARINAGNGDSPASTTAFLDGSGTSSSFESTVLEQTQANVSGFTAASTVKLLDISLQKGDTVYDINNGAGSTLSTYNNTIRPLLAANYNSLDLESIDNYVSSGFRVIAPLHGQIAVGQWTGVGFKTMFGSPDTGVSYGEIISGGLSGASRRLAGGFGGVDDPPFLLVPNADGSMTPVSLEDYLANPSLYPSPGGTGETVGDPLDHQKGSYVYKHEDLTVGPEPFPHGLRFERSYDSNAQGSAGPLGAGWTHNFAITATVGSDGFSGMGGASLLSAVDSIAALYVSADLMNGQQLTGQNNVEQFVLEVVVNHWFTDQLTQNAVYVGQGWTTEQFVKVSDGTYASQLGSVSLLDAPSGNFRYRTKTGIAISFNASGQVSSWANTAGAAVAFAYSNNVLSTVTNQATGRQLTLSYSSGLVSSVTDGIRTVSYGYTGGNLTAFTDALQQNTTYSYDISGQEDISGHLTQIYYPSQPASAFVTNFYDSMGRVKQQTDANGNLTQAFFAGSRTEINDGVGNRHVWYIGPLGDATTEIKDYGPSPHLNMTYISTYDAQGDMLTMTMPEGNSTAYTYNSTLNRLTVTETPKPGSPLAPRTQTFTYLAPVASFPNFQEIQTYTDPNSNVLTYTYDANTGNLLKLTEPTVTKPGAGSSAPQQVFTYTAIGMTLTSLDAEGRLTQFQYDPAHADQVTAVTIDSGRLNLIAQYGYDSFGDRTSVTDANGHTTTSTFDYLRRLVQVTGPVAGVTTSYTYFPNGQVKTVTRNAASPETTRYAYTLSDQVSLVTDPLGNTTSTVYDADDRLQTLTKQVTATVNRQRTYSYDALSRLIRISDTSAGSPGLALESHTYTLNGRDLAVTDANAHTTAYAYDGFDRTLQTTFPDTSTELYQRDTNGNVVQTTTRSGLTIGYTFDGLNRTLSKTPQGESAGKVTYGYDLSGRLLQASDQSSANPYLIAYDTAGRATSYTDQQGRNTLVGYDGVGNATRIQWPANTNGAGAYFVTYQFDALNRMVEIDQNGSSATPLAKYQWDQLSRPTGITYGDGTIDSYSQYDAADNLLALSQSFTGGQENVTFTTKPSNTLLPSAPPPMLQLT
jgi:YD repeat-containing protein